jgi:hypothetical protein
VEDKKKVREVKIFFACRITTHHQRLSLGEARGSSSSEEESRKKMALKV